MPCIAALLLGRPGLLCITTVEFDEEFGAYGGDLLIRLPVFTDISFSVEQWVDVEGGSCGFAAQLPEALDELLLNIVGEIVLLAKVDNATGRDCDRLVS